MSHDLTAARKRAKCDADAAAIAWAQDRMEELEQALKQIRARAAFEQREPTGLHMTCLSLIEKDATLALAGVDTYEHEAP